MAFSNPFTGKNIRDWVKQYFQRSASSSTDAGELSGDEVVPLGDGKKTTAQSIANLAEDYKIYTALIQQSGTDNPTVTVIKNTLGGDILWERLDVGIYKGSLAGMFPNPGKVYFNATWDHNYDTFICIPVWDVDYVVLNRFNASGVGQDVFYLLFLEIKVYP